MSDIETELRREIVALREQLADANRALEAMARGEVDAVAASEVGTPVLLQAAQEELRNSRALLRAVFDGSMDALLLADDDGVYVDANPAACELFGLPRDQLVGKKISDFAPRDHDTGARFKSFLEVGRMRGQFPLLRPDGARRVLDYSAVANVSPGLHLSALRDITDRVAAEDALRRSEVRFRAMIEKGQDGITLLSADVRTVYQSPAVEHLLGYRLDEAEQMSWQDFVDEEERPKLASALAKLMEGPGSTIDLEFRIRKRDGSRCWLELTATNWLSDPDIGAIVANFRDITERRSSSEEREGFFLLSLDLLCIARDGRFQRLNPAWEMTLGWSLDELCARPWLDFVHPDDHAATVQQGAKLADGRVVVRFLNRYRCKDGSYRWLQWAAIPTSEGLIYACAHDVTAERASAERDRLLFVASPLPMLLVDSETLRLLDANEASERAYGYARDELLSMTLNDLVVEEQRERLRSSLEELAKGAGSIVVSDRQYKTKSGERRRVQVTSHRLDVNGADAILKVIVDVTDAKRLEEEREGFFLLSLDLLCIAGIDGRFRRLNLAWETTLGWSLDELCARHSLDFVHPDDHVATVQEAAKLAENRVVVRFLNRYRCKDGTYRWLQWAAIRTAEGLIYACAHDVTAERASAHRDRLLFKENPVPMLLTDIETLRFLDANDAAVERYGYGHDELLAMTVQDLVVAEQHDTLANDVRTLDAMGRVIVRHRRHRTKSGLTRDVEVTGHRMDVDGRPTILSVIIDVTDARRLEEERARYVERLRLLELSVSRLNDIVLITKATPLSKPGPEIVYVNEAFERITGYSRGEAIGKTPRILQGPDTDPAALARLRAALERAEPVREEILNYTKAGVPYWLELDVAPVRDDAGVLTHFVAIERDTTEQHRVREALRLSEERLRQAQKMEAIGNLAGGIAHDFNNLLSVILSYTSLGMEDLPPADSLRQDLEEVHRAGLRATDMTRQLLAFSRKQMLQPSVIDVSAAVRGVEKMLARLLGEDIELALTTSADAGRAFVDPSQLEQVIMNLVVNARDAMPDGGTITVETSSVVLDEADAALHPGVKPGSYVLLAVSDTGVGMDKATQERAFEPFFTTKEQGKGTGLGLSTVYGIVQQSGGHIWLYSEPGQGTTFKIYLPRTDRIEDASAVKPLPGDSLRGSETILLVEDEAPVRQVVRSILRKNGYHVLEAQNAGEALLVCEQFTATIHLLLTDVVMPRMSGRQLAERLAVLRPAMKILFISGYTEDTIIHHGVLDAGVNFLAKPIQPSALLKKVREVLDPRRMSLAPP